MRYVVREGTVRGEGQYLNAYRAIDGTLLCWQWKRLRENAEHFTSREAAAKEAGQCDGRVVRLLTAEEAKAKAAAKARREALEEVLAGLREMSDGATIETRRGIPNECDAQDMLDSAIGVVTDMLAKAEAGR